MQSRRRPRRGLAPCRSASRALLGAALAPAAFSVAVARADVAADRVVEVVARRFAFEPAEIEAIEGERVRLVLRSADTTHGLEIPAFDVKVAIPKGGATVSVDFVAGPAGRYRLKCSEYCGSGHSGMKGELVVRARGER